MNFDLTSEQKQIQDLARSFAQKEIVPRVREYDRAGKFPLDLVKKMGELGFLGCHVPVEYGGSGLDYISLALMAEEFGAACSSVQTFISVQLSLVTSAIVQWGTEEQKKKYVPKLVSGELIGCYCLSEPNSGSDAVSMTTMASKKNGKWVLNGTKMWISNGKYSDVAIVFAQTDKSLEKKYKGIVAFIVDTKSKGYTANEIEGRLGLRASSTCEVVLENVEVPEENVLGKVGDGFKVAMNALDFGRYSLAAGTVGAARACLEAAVKYAKERVQFGKAIGSFQLVQAMIAEMVTEVDAARLLVHRAGHLKNTGAKNTLETSIAKLYATEVAQRCAYKAIQVHGGYGFVDEFPVERFYRDVRVSTLYEGTSEVQKLIIGGQILGIKAFS